MSTEHDFRNPNDSGYNPEYHTGKKCINGCGNPAGTLWSPYWCKDCNIERMNNIDKQFEKIRKAFAV